MIEIEVTLPREGVAIRPDPARTAVEIIPVPDAHVIVGSADEWYPEPPLLTVIPEIAPRIGANVPLEPPAHVITGSAAGL